MRSPELACVESGAGLREVRSWLVRSPKLACVKSEAGLCGVWSWLVQSPELACMEYKAGLCRVRSWLVRSQEQACAESGASIYGVRSWFVRSPEPQHTQCLGRGMKQISEMEGKPFTSSLNICSLACCPPRRHSIFQLMYEYLMTT